ncbi:MAG TPA: ABC transporter ATP-binding protein, partial [Rhodospirillaceae bacterium]|nr:ABC transporter ATP-binding protein [Rhodospirillaceae bacterium]
KEIQRKTGVTFIFITHDQGEALTMSDRIAVMKAGVVEQVDTVDNLYAHPRTPFVATFVGENNVLEGKISHIQDGFAIVETQQGAIRGINQDKATIGDKAMVFVRPERTKLLNGAALDNTFEVDFERRDLEGAFVNLFFKSDTGSIIVHEANLGQHKELEGRAKIGFNASDAIVMRSGELSDE